MFLFIMKLILFTDSFFLISIFLCKQEKAADCLKLSSKFSVKVTHIDCDYTENNGIEKEEEYDDNDDPTDSLDDGDVEAEAEAEAEVGVSDEYSNTHRDSDDIKYDKYGYEDDDDDNNCDNNNRSYNDDDDDDDDDNNNHNNHNNNNNNDNNNDNHDNNKNNNNNNNDHNNNNDDDSNSNSTEGNFQNQTKRNKSIYHRKQNEHNFKNNFLTVEEKHNDNIKYTFIDDNQVLKTNILDMKIFSLPNNSEKITIKSFRKKSTEILKEKIDVSRILENRDFIRNDNNNNNLSNGFDDEKSFDDFYDIDNDEVIRYFISHVYNYYNIYSD